MAIQAQMHPDSSGLTLIGAPEWGGGGGGAVGLYDEMGLNMQRQQQLMVARQMQQFQSQFPRNNAQFLNQASLGVSGGRGVDDAAAFAFSQSLVSQVEKQSLEIDQFIVSQSERLRMVVREQRKREMADMMKKIEAQTSAVLKQKEEEIAKAADHASQLETFLMKLQYEKQMWQLISRQNELHVIHLSNTLEQLQETAAIHGAEYYNNADNVYNPAAVEDTESCCDENEDGALAEYEQQSSLEKMVCNVCQSRELGMVFLPCRHLCSCTVCGPMIDFCPVCQTEKKATIETLFH